MDQNKPLPRSEAARLREIAAMYRRVAESMNDPVTIASTRQMANDYEADADELDESIRAATPVSQGADTPATAARRTGMGPDHLLRKLLLARPRTGSWALMLGLVAIAVPTVIRGAVNGVVSGNAFGPYVPFVILSALLLKPWQTLAVAIGCAFAADFFFVEPYLQFAAAPSDLFGIGAFVVSSAMVIFVASGARQLLESFPRMQVA